VAFTAFGKKNDGINSANDPVSISPTEEYVGNVKAISGGREHEPHIRTVAGLHNGLFYDAVWKAPPDFADELIPIMLDNDFQVVINGGMRFGNQSFEIYGLIDGIWEKVYERVYEFNKSGGEAVFEYPFKFLDDSINPEYYILSMQLAWQNGLEGSDLEYVVYLYSFKLLPDTHNFN
jgi:hypothetical protein